MSAMRCPRQAWLQEQLAGDTNDKALLGQLLHELLQWGLARAMELRQAGLGGLERQAMLDEVRRNVGEEGWVGREEGLEWQQMLDEVRHDCMTGCGGE